MFCFVLTFCFALFVQDLSTKLLVTHQKTLVAVDPTLMIKDALNVPRRTSLSLFMTPTVSFVAMVSYRV
jgi:hypothetical protein